MAVVSYEIIGYFVFGMVKHDIIVHFIYNANSLITNILLFALSMYHKIKMKYLLYDTKVPIS